MGKDISCRWKIDDSLLFSVCVLWFYLLWFKGPKQCIHWNLITSAQRTICALRLLYPNRVSSAWLKQAKSKITFTSKKKPTQKKTSNWNLKEAYLSTHTKTDSWTHRPRGQTYSCWGVGIIRGFGMDMVTLLFFKWITNKDLLYSAGNSAHCYVAAWMGWESGGRRDTYGWLSPLLITWSYHDIGNWLYSNTKQTVLKKTDSCIITHDFKGTEEPAEQESYS